MVARGRSAIRRLIASVLLVATAALLGVYVAVWDSQQRDDVERPVASSSSSSPSSKSFDLDPPSFLHVKGGFPLIQCYIAPDSVRAEHPIKEDFQHTWLAENPTLRNEFFDSTRARRFITDVYGADSREMRQYDSHRWYTERADYFRMLAVYTMGGLYIDNDVEPLVPIDHWLPKFGWNPREIARNLLVVGVEMPRSRGGLSLQIVNFNFLATHPRHPALRAVLDVIDSASEVITEGTDNVMIRTGPLAFTRGVLNWLGHEIDPKATDNRGLLFTRREGEGEGEGDKDSKGKDKDVHNAVRGRGRGREEQQQHAGRGGETWRLLVLPYRAFGNHPAHGDDVNKEPYDEHLVHHHFHGTWRPDKYRGKLHFKIKTTMEEDEDESSASSAATAAAAAARMGRRGGRDKGGGGGGGGGAGGASGGGEGGGDNNRGGGVGGKKFENWQEYAASMPKHPPMPG